MIGIPFAGTVAILFRGVREHGKLADQIAALTGLAEVDLFSLIQPNLRTIARHRLAIARSIAGITPFAPGGLAAETESLRSHAMELMNQNASRQAATAADLQKMQHHLMTLAETSANFQGKSEARSAATQESFDMLKRNLAQVAAQLELSSRTLTAWQSESVARAQQLEARAVTLEQKSLLFEQKSSKLEREAAALKDNLEERIATEAAAIQQQVDTRFASAAESSSTSFAALQQFARSTRLALYAVATVCIGASIYLAVR